jgi:two-component system, OmpR family, sensor kinase
MAAERGITLSYEPDGEMPIRADEALLRRLTMNLLDNAIKYTPEGGKVGVACARTGSEYSLTVRDTGPGIPAEARDKIFERFFRLDPARSASPLAASTSSVTLAATPEEPLRTARPASAVAAPPSGERAGAGLGLAIARWIAEAHYGRLILAHSDTSGSVFAAFFPTNEAVGTTAGATEAGHGERQFAK